MTKKQRISFSVEQKLEYEYAKLMVNEGDTNKQLQGRVIALLFAGKNNT